ncbi:hypothetical protein AB3N59_06850 [Leptospira sp. WS92.C1]
MNPIFQTLKIGTVLFWILFGINVSGFFLLGQPIDSLLRLVGVGIFTVHLFEIAYFWFTLKHKSAYPLSDALQILVFGVFHLIPIKNR